MKIHPKLVLWCFTLAATTGFLVTAKDLYHDIANQKDFAHILSDTMIAAIIVLATVFAWLYFRSPRSGGQSVPLAGDMSVIEAQLKAWRLTPAETQVALHIVRGLNFHQIADLLEKSERTVRQQAISIYAKAGFRNRAEFTGHFVENLHRLED